VFWLSRDYSENGCTTNDAVLIQMSDRLFSHLLETASGEL